MKLNIVSGAGPEVENRARELSGHRVEGYGFRVHAEEGKCVLPNQRAGDPELNGNSGVEIIVAGNGELNSQRGDGGPVQMRHTGMENIVRQKRGTKK